MRSEEQPQFKGPCIHCKYPVYEIKEEVISMGPDDCLHEVEEPKDENLHNRI